MLQQWTNSGLGARLNPVRQGTGETPVAVAAVPHDALLKRDGLVKRAVSFLPHVTPSPRVPAAKTHCGPVSPLFSYCHCALLLGDGLWSVRSAFCLTSLLPQEYLQPVSFAGPPPAGLILLSALLERDGLAAKAVSLLPHVTPSPRVPTARGRPKPASLALINPRRWSSTSTNTKTERRIWPLPRPTAKPRFPSPSSEHATGSKSVSQEYPYGAFTRGGAARLCTPWSLARHQDCIMPATSSTKAIIFGIFTTSSLSRPGGYMTGLREAGTTA